MAYVLTLPMHYIDKNSKIDSLPFYRWRNDIVPYQLLRLLHRYIYKGTNIPDLE